MNRNAIIGGAVALVLVAIGGYWWFSKNDEAPPTSEPTPIVKPVVPPPNYPVPESDTPKASLPELEASDPALVESAKSVLGKQAVEQWLIPMDIVRHIVVTVDNLPRKKYAERQKPLKAIPGRFAVEGAEDARAIGASNTARYAPFVKLVEALDMQRAAKEYFRLYPLFQEAYRDLGYPDGYFNNRLVEAIDDLLAAPRITGPIKLTQPNVLYEYADPKLENLSAGQKIMIRIGAENQDAIKSKLRELRAAIVAGK